MRIRLTHTMHFFLWVFLVIHLFNTSDRALEKEEKKWSEKKRLSWKDFRATPVQESRADAVSSVQLRIHYKLGKTSRQRVTCVFLRKHSWSKTTLDRLLDHEQGHFDIGEIHARILRQNLLTAKDLIDKRGWKVIDSLFKLQVNSLSVMQEEYDLDTNKSRDHEAQEKWKEKIEQQLRNLAAFKK